MSQAQIQRQDAVPVEEYTAFLVGGVQQRRPDSPYKDLHKGSETHLVKNSEQQSQPIFQRVQRGRSQGGAQVREVRVEQGHRLTSHLHPEAGKPHYYQQRTQVITQQQPQIHTFGTTQRNELRVQGEYRPAASNVSVARSQRVKVNPPNPPPPQKRVEMVPVEEKYIDYIEQKQRVPVQKMYTDYFEIEHITDYVPIERYDIVYVTEAREVTDYKLEYVPVERKIIHLSEETARREGLAQGKNLTELPPGLRGNQRGGQVIVNDQVVKVNGFVYNEGQRTAEFQPTRSRTHFVTTDGYDPNENIRRIDQILTESAVREQRAKENSRLIM